jgi:hypothetical protein
MRTIRFCEPLTMMDYPYFNYDFIVNESMYNKIKERVYEAGPFQDYDCVWMCGTRNTVTKVGTHGNDIAMTGLVDITDMTDAELKALKEKINDMWNTLNDDLEISEKVQHINKHLTDRLLFMGETPAGDVGADIFVHYDNKKEIDTFIIVTPPIENIKKI